MLTFFLLLAAVIYNFRASEQVCNIPVSSENERRMPLFLEENSNGYGFAIPVEGNVGVRNNGKIALACPYHKNFLVKTHANLSVAICKKETLKINDESIFENDLECHSLIKGTAVSTNTKCAKNQGFIIDIGYQITKHSWLTLFEVCYNNVTGNTFYSKHTILSDAIKYASKSKYRPEFSTSLVGRDIAVSVAYKQKYQKAVFNSLLGSTLQAEKYLTNNSYLSRGHLAPDADFIFAPWQYTTYFYVNTNPQWQQINGGNWRRVESIVRNHALKYRDRIDVYTGSHGVLELEDVHGKKAEIYMLPHKLLPVPKYFWKLLHSVENQEAIVLVALNNPFLHSPPGELLCPNVCNDYGWGSSKWEKMQKGFVFCCTFESFAVVLGTVPKLHVKSVMKNAKV